MRISDILARIYCRMETASSSSTTARCLSCGISCPVDKAIKHSCPKCAFCGETVRIWEPEKYFCSARKVEIMSKVLLIGSPGTGGKTSLLFRMLNGYFKQSTRATIGVDFGLHEVSFDKIPVHMKLQLWDISGLDRFRSMTRVYFRDAEAAIVSCDISRKLTFVEMDNWLDDLALHAPGAQAVMVANKQDLISPEELQEFAIEADAFVARHQPLVLGWFPISVRTGFNIVNMLDFLLRHLIDDCLFQSGGGFSGSREMAKRVVMLLIMVRKFRSKKRDCLLTWLPKEIGMQVISVFSINNQTVLMIAKLVWSCRYDNVLSIDLNEYKCAEHA
jgi:small GTP-binding protein